MLCFTVVVLSKQLFYCNAKFTTVYLIIEDNYVTFKVFVLFVLDTRI